MRETLGKRSRVHSNPVNWRYDAACRDKAGSKRLGREVQAGAPWSKGRRVSNGTEAQTPGVQPGRRRRTRRILLWSGLVAGLIFAGVVIAGGIVLHDAGPMLKDKVVDALSARFDSRVELKQFHVSVLRGFEVSGSGLELYPHDSAMRKPLLQVDRFSFRVLDWRQLFDSPMYINRVEVRGLTVLLPPKAERRKLVKAGGPSGGGGGEAREGAALPITVGEILVDRAKLILENGTPGKPPLRFIVHRVTLQSVGAGRPLEFHATLVNPKPVGNIDSSGHFGPFDAGDPGETPVSGSYRFRHADLSTIKGIGGMLSSDGSYSGKLDHIEVDGTTDTPDFRLDGADHAMPLKTKFHAIVDGTTGNTYLRPVDAWLMKTHIVAEGKVVRVPGVRGRAIHLHVRIGPGRIEDLLRLAVKANPPLMNGEVRVRTSFDLPPGQGVVADRLQMRGSFAIRDAHFTNPRIQRKVDQLSLRGQGKAAMAKKLRNAAKDGSGAQSHEAEVASEMKGNFTFGLRRLTISSLDYQVPGARAILSGVYALDGQTLNFSGKARLEAHVSQMVTGWKRWLLKPADPFFAKNGAGTEVPIRITGTRSAPHFSVGF